MRPGTVTALFALLLIAVIVFVQLRHTPPLTTTSAADLLQRSTIAEEALATRTDQVLHRTISLEERNPAGEVIARRRIEVWHSGEKGITARRLYDDRGALIAGDWRRADGVQTLYHHGAKPQLQLAPEKRRDGPISADRIWELDPSAKEFTSLIGSSQSTQVQQTANAYVISYAQRQQEVGGKRPVKATLTLSKSDLHATELTLLVQPNDVPGLTTETQRSVPVEFRFVESRFERRPVDAVAPALFEPDADLISLVAPAKNPKAETPVAVTQPPGPVTATAALEVEVLVLLHQVGADIGEQISVTRTPEGLLQVQGLAQTDKRKRELLSALSPLAGNPAVRLDIQTLDEALARQPKNQVSSGLISTETTQPSSNTLPIDQELRHYFAERNVPEAQTEEAIRQFADRTLRRSLQMLKHAAALNALAQRFSPEDLRTLDADAKAKWLLLMKQHAQALEEQTAVLRREVAPIFPGVAAQNVNEPAEIQSEADLARTVQQLFGICSENDRAIRLAFSISPEASKDSVIRSVQFWRSFQNAEHLAAAVKQYRQK